MSQEELRKEPLDALIVTAVKEEWDAVLAVDTGADAGSTWEKLNAPTRLEVRVRNFQGTGGELRIAVIQALGMGGVRAVGAAAPLLTKYHIRCLAMCGVCAGRRGEVELGDVIIADRMWTYDTGKQYEDHTKQDIDMYRIYPPEWQHQAERFVPRDAPWLAQRPRSYEMQGDWLLARVYAGGDLSSGPEQATKCPDFKIVVEKLWEQGLLKKPTLTLTVKGKKWIEEKLLLHQGTLPEPKEFAVHCGPIASGSKVVEDSTIFDRLSTPVRKVLGVEMEASAIATLAHEQQLEGAVVMKAVMDHADRHKSNNFKAFAARASAECLIAFLRENLRPRIGAEPIPGLRRSPETSSAIPTKAPAFKGDITLVYEAPQSNQSISERLAEGFRSTGCSECKVTIGQQFVSFEMVNADVAAFHQRLRDRNLHRPIPTEPYELIEAWIEGRCMYELLPPTHFNTAAPQDIGQRELRTHLGNVDVLLVTATDLEREAVMSALEPLPGKKSILRGCLWKTTFRIGRLGRYFVGHIESMGSNERDSSTLGIREALTTLPHPPKAVIIVGTAWGADRGKQRLGDVLVADSLAPYAPGKISEKTAVGHGQLLSSGTILASRFRTLCDDWTMRRRIGPVRVHQGLVLSGDKVNADPPFLAKLLSQYPTALGGEIGGASVYAAADAAKVEVILAKGICDWAEGKIDDTQRFAATAAVSLVKHLLEKPDVLMDLGATDREMQDGKELLNVPAEERTTSSVWYRLLRAVGLARGASKTPAAELTVQIIVEGEGYLAVIQRLFIMIAEMKNARGSCTLRIRTMGKGSVILELDGSEEDCRELTSMLDRGTLEAKLQRRVLQLRSSSPTVPRVYPQRVAFTPGSVTTVCHESFIEGFKQENNDALRLLSRRTTTRLDECAVYLTEGQRRLIYAHSNFRKQGSTDATKIATNETNDLRTLLINVAFRQYPVGSELDRMQRAHENDVIYLVDSKLFDNSGMPLVSLNGASRVIRVNL